MIIHHFYQITKAIVDLLDVVEDGQHDGNDNEDADAQFCRLIHSSDGHSNTDTTGVQTIDGRNETIDN